MVNIALTNRNPDSPDRQVTIHLETGVCTFVDHRTVELKRLLSDSDFSHPLFTEAFTAAPDYFFHYQYDDIDGLLRSAIFVYSVLLQVDKPLACRFKINPSPIFQRVNVPKDIYFSTHSYKSARKMIEIAQLCDLVKHRGGYEYKFSEDILIDDLFTLEELPETLDGDSLYQTDLEVLHLLKSPHDFKAYELRYINRGVGYGAFSRGDIKKGEILFLYSGVKTANQPDNLDYTYNNRRDSLNMFLDARLQGNITRFINHAPNPSSDNITVDSSSLLEANMKTTYYYLNGIEVVGYKAIRDILKGEQLFVDYGALFFGEAEPRRFKANGQVMGPNKKKYMESSSQTLKQLRMMARFDIREAQSYLRLRMFVIVLVMVTLMGVLKYV